MNKELTGLRFDQNKLDMLKLIRTQGNINPFLTGKYLAQQSEESKVNLTPEQFDAIEVTDCDMSEYLSQFEPTLIQVVRHAKYGAEVKGYGRGNWKGGMLWSRVVNSLLRHLFLFLVCGITRDKESGSKHMTAVVWNSMALLTYIEEGIGENDL